MGNKNLHCQRVVPFWLLLLDNLPTVSMFFLGTAILIRVTLWLGIGYLFYAGFAIAWFWAHICPHCHHFATFGCPCGYGHISSLFFKKKNGTNFRRIFRKNIVVLFPCWFIPPVVTIYVLLQQFDRALFVLMILFSITAFLLVPYVSKFVGCKNCASRSNCPWINKEKK
ncbi:MAG: hypothetical protein MJB14_20785 [Spirochaetes bacterium]|nr:hypothetical protein [Spirochaetota bacterium]